MPITHVYLQRLPQLTCQLGKPLADNKQLLDEVEHDIMNYQNRGLGYLPKPKAEADNTGITHPQV